MKKNAMTTAVVAGLAGVAGIANISNAVNLNPDGLGEVLIYPYYTVNSDNLTLISVVNTTDNAKAVKVRLLEGRNSREVLDFNLYLSRHDVWTAFVFETPEDFAGQGFLTTGGAALATRDNSCTVPRIQGAAPDPVQGVGQLADGTSFALARPFAYINVAGGLPQDQNSDGGPQNIERTREGYIEMIEMGTVIGAAASAVTHGSSGVPANCNYVVGSWFGGVGARWDVNPQNLLEDPSGGLFGGASIVNVNDGTLLTYNADAIDGFSDTIIHTNPGDLRPNLTDANTAGLVVPDAVVRSIVFQQGQLITSNFTAGNRIDAVSSIFAHDRVFNEYNVEADVAAQSEWVLTFPTKRFYVDPAIVGNTARAPFTRVFGPAGACEPIALTYYDREEQTPSGPPGGFSPPIPGQAGPALCWEAQVVTFNQAGDSAILGSTYPRNIALATGFDAGWLNIGLAAGHRSRASLEGHQFDGLPVTGFWAWTVSNNTLEVDGATVLSNYGGLFRHRASRRCLRIDGTTEFACS